MDGRGHANRIGGPAVFVPWRNQQDEQRGGPERQAHDSERLSPRCPDRPPPQLEAHGRRGRQRDGIAGPRLDESQPHAEARSRGKQGHWHRSPPPLPRTWPRGRGKQANADQSRQGRQSQQRRGDVDGRDAQVRNVEAPGHDEGRAEQDVASCHLGGCRKREGLPPRPRPHYGKKQGPEGEKEELRVRQVVAPGRRLDRQAQKQEGERSSHAPRPSRPSDEQRRSGYDDRAGCRAPGPFYQVSSSPPGADERRAVRGGKDRQSPSGDGFPFERLARERKRPAEFRRFHGKLSRARHETRKGPAADGPVIDQRCRRRRPVHLNAAGSRQLESSRCFPPPRLDAAVRVHQREPGVGRRSVESFAGGREELAALDGDPAAGEGFCHIRSAGEGIGAGREIAHDPLDGSSELGRGFVSRPTHARCVAAGHPAIEPQQRRDSHEGGGNRRFLAQGYLAEGRSTPRSRAARIASS